jgi:hypothetical protein
VSFVERTLRTHSSTYLPPLIGPRGDFLSLYRLPVGLRSEQHEAWPRLIVHETCAIGGATSDWPLRCKRDATGASQIARDCGPIPDASTTETNKEDPYESKLLYQVNDGRVPAYCNSSVTGKENVPDRIDIESGTAVFEASTNVPGVEVKGKSGLLRGRVGVSHSDGRLVLDEIEATVPVKSLSTGMGVRDEHMRKYIFTTGQGQVPGSAFHGRQFNL